MPDGTQYPRTDPTLLAIKTAAAAGTGRGVLYDQGLMSVVEQVETGGVYSPNNLRSLIALGTLPDLAALTLTPEERDELARELAHRGWTADQAIEYARGVEDGEAALAAYRAAATTPLDT